MTQRRLDQYLLLGMELGKLAVAAEINPAATYASIKALTHQLETFHLPNSLVALKQLQTFEQNLLNMSSQTRPHWHSVPFKVHLHSAANSLVDVALSEAETTFLRVANRQLVKPKLRELGKEFPLTPIQTTLLSEVICCIETGNWRSTAVMSWNLAFDLIRTWVFNNHLETFNEFLCSGGKNRADPICEYDDFFRLSERSVLDWFRLSKLILEKRSRMLVEWLDYRNDLAHPNFVEADGLAVVGKVHELLGIVREVIR